MSSTMSFSAMFSQSPAANHSRNMSSEYSFFPDNHSRSDTSESAYSSIGSPVSDSSRFGQVVGSPFSVSSDERYMLGTPPTVTPEQSLSYPTKSNCPAPTSPTSVDIPAFRSETASPIEKGKGKDRQANANHVESPAVIVADDGNTESALRPSVQGSGVRDTSAVTEPTSDYSSDISNTRPSPLVHSHTYSGPDISTSPYSGGRVSAYDSGRSTPTAPSTASSMHSKISNMRIKLKRKGSSLVDIMSFKNQGTSRSEIKTPEEASRGGSRSRSGSSAAASVLIEGNKTAYSSSAQDRYNSSKKNLRTKSVNKFDFSTSRAGALQFTKKQTGVPTLSPGNDSVFEAGGPVSSPHAITPRAPSGSQPGTANNRRHATPLPAMPKPAIEQTPICLGRVVSESPIAIPLSPLSPPLLDTKHHSRVDALGGSIPDFELLESPPKTTPAFLMIRGAPVSQRVSYFDTKLPPELKLRVLATILDLHKAEHNRAIGNVSEKFSKEERADAARYLGKRWIGDMAGKRELFCISRVSRSWRELAFDGQLWKDVDLHQAVGHIPPSALLTVLAKNQGGYIRNLGLHGWNSLPPRALTFALTDVGGAHCSTVTTRLQRLDLQGCTSLDANTVSFIVRHSPELTWISLRGLTFVSGDIIRRIAVHAKQMQHLDISRCWRLSLLHECIFDEDNSWPALKTLKLGGGVAETGIFQWLARAAPNLETLDVSHSIEIDDDDVKDLVSAPTDSYQEARTQRRTSIQHASTPKDNTTDKELRVVILTPSQANQPGSDFACDGMIPRRVTKLRHVNFSHCPNITQKAASYLAYAVPHMQILEMANVGEMSSDGIVAMLSTTPHIKKIDLEGATQACDRVLAALTYANRQHSVIDQSMPGKELEALSLGHASNITTDGALKLLRACPNLVQLNLEGTPVTDILVKDFIRRRRHSSCLRVTDCRGVNRNVIDAYENTIRYRSGWRGYQAVPMEYSDAAAGQRGKAGPKLDECGDVPVVQSFWGWCKVGRSSGIASQTVSSDINREDAVRSIARLLREAEMQGGAEATRGCSIM
ncbi:hypothetical protein QFC21_003322 [Naganishia friedmannii]|uniref:Uncharacterized protein n=1 Tax=Naganishia friedmannii TaxID=89922 RepID=A0ACC2VPS4_9TREE|nr:hypothetical protein QFC21_003322 [Naganishia friedmannii]